MSFYIDGSVCITADNLDEAESIASALGAWQSIVETGYSNWERWVEDDTSWVY